MSSEEDRARALLREMQVRLVAGPTAALGVGVHATPAEIRHAWLELTKKFHPARFGRMAQDVQRQSNEVFLSLKAAHESLAAKPKPAGRSQSPSTPPTNRPGTKPFGVPIQPSTPPQGNRPSSSAVPQRTPPTPAARISTPVMPPPKPGPSTGQSQPIPRVTPTAQSQPLPRVGALANQSQPLPRVAASTSTGEALDPALAPILEMIARSEWDRAQQAIDSLALRNPQSKRYQAMASYCRGRRAMSERRFDDARVEFTTSLMQDGTLEIAKSAITELMIAARRR